ncbi:hypothetical protein FA95DRAFT_1505423, partial [Auriscalpium vulgare]
IVDQEERILVQLAGCPRNDEAWPGLMREVSAEMSSVASATFSSTPQEIHARGRHPTLCAGYSFGGGPKHPYTVNESHKQAAGRLIRFKGVGRIAGFQSSVMSLKAPRLFNHYKEVLSDIRQQDPSLHSPFPNSVFPTVTFNLGPQAVTFPHRDSKNVPYGWCAITALGDYDPTKGGHLYIWELKMVIEFPPGATILIPSAVFTHGNTPIQAGETRQSITQYCAGALIRWHRYGFRTESAMKRQDPELASRLQSGKHARWAEALQYFSKASELADDLRAHKRPRHK